MGWVDRLVTVTGWSAEPGDFDWSDTEGVLGTPLPTDFKELRRRFPDWAPSATVFWCWKHKGRRSRWAAVPRRSTSLAIPDVLAAIVAGQCSSRQVVFAGARGDPCAPAPFTARTNGDEIWFPRSATKS